MSHRNSTTYNLVVVEDNVCILNLLSIDHFVSAPSFLLYKRTQSLKQSCIRFPASHIEYTTQGLPR